MLCPCGDGWVSGHCGSGQWRGRLQRLHYQQQLLLRRGSGGPSWSRKRWPANEVPVCHALTKPHVILICRQRHTLHWQGNSRLAQSDCQRESTRSLLQHCPERNPPLLLMNSAMISLSLKQLIWEIQRQIFTGTREIVQDAWKLLSNVEQGHQGWIWCDTKVGKNE